MRCWNCLKFSHTKNFCSDPKLCSNCGLDFHITEDFEECDAPKSCVNCNGSHSSLDRRCPVYLTQKEINTIMVNNKTSHREAKRIYNERHPEVSFAQTVKGNLANVSQTSSRIISEVNFFFNHSIVTVVKLLILLI